MEYFFDHEAWKRCKVDDLWIFDKLILSKKLGYVCGPVGVNVPEPGTYILRPITNILGMGREARIVYIEEDTEHLIPGNFWCEVFDGRHLSVDYINQQQVLCVEGFKESKRHELYKFRSWQVVEDNIPFPSILKDLDYPYINCEFIGGNLIEVHLRLNSDFKNNEKELIVVWKGESIEPPDGFKFVPDHDFKRLGFFKRI